MKNRDLPRVQVSLLSVAVVLSLGACGSGDRGTRQERGTESATVVRVGFRLTLADIAPIVLKEKGLLHRGSITIEAVPIASPAVAMQELASGGIHAMAGLTIEPILNSVDSTGKTDLKIYYVQVDSAGGGWISVVSAPKSSYRTLSDLAGQTVGALPTEQARFLVRETLRGGGVPDQQIKVSDYSPAAPLNGLISGDQAAIWGLEPALARAEAQGGRRLVMGPISKLVFNGAEVPMSASVVSRRFLHEHPEAYDALVAATEEAMRAIDADPAGTRALFAASQYGGLDSTVYKLLHFPVMRSPKAPDMEKRLDDVIEWLRRSGLVKSSVKASNLLN